MKSDDLRITERRAFRAVVDTGLWDVLLASVLAMFAIAPLLSDTLGDFWSSAIFLPVWAGIYLAIRIIRDRLVVPRVGQVRFGSYRTTRLRRFTVVMLVMNLAAVVLGLVAFTAFEQMRTLWAIPIGFFLTVLLFSSMAAYFLEIPRFFLYGIVLAVGSLVGEWLWRQEYASHHGYPLVFGVAAGLIAAVGMVKFASLIRSSSPIVSNELGGVENDG
jgi:hypothetical protein